MPDFAQKLNNHCCSTVNIRIYVISGYLVRQLLGQEVRLTETSQKIYINHSVSVCDNEYQ